MNTPGREDDAALTLIERINHLVAALSDDKKKMLLETLIEWQQKEQRSDNRIDCFIAVDYATPKRAYRDFMQDLSKGGVYIETRELLNVNDPISLTFTIPKTSNHFKMTGRVVRCDEKGVGVEFDNKLSQFQEQIIKNAVK